MQLHSKEYATAEAFLNELGPEACGCVVTEFRLLGINGIDLQQALAADGFALPVIFVTAYPETTLTVSAMQNGAVTVLEKPFREQELWDSISKALRRNQTIMRIDAKHSEFRRRLTRLTKKEREVLDLLMQGEPNKAIANSLNISLRTVEARRHNIFKKTSTDSIAELVRMILQSGSGEGQWGDP